MGPEDLWNLVRAIPAGRVASYGAVGRALESPTSGYQVGRWMANCPADVPWWRVVAKDGRLPVGKRDFNLQRTQAEHLMAEGVDVEDGVVPMDRYAWEPATSERDSLPGLFDA